MSGRRRAARNVATHTGLGEGAEALRSALADPQAAQRGQRRASGLVDADVKAEVGKKDTGRIEELEGRVEGLTVQLEQANKEKASVDGQVADLLVQLEEAKASAHSMKDYYDKKILLLQGQLDVEVDKNLKAHEKLDTAEARITELRRKQVIDKQEIGDLAERLREMDNLRTAAAQSRQGNKPWPGPGQKRRC